MLRILKPGPRPIIALSVMFGLALSFPISIGVTKVMWLDATKMAVCILAVYGVLCFMVRGGRIIITSEAITLRSALGLKQSVCFHDIVVSIPHLFAEPDHPVSLEIFTDSGERTDEGEMVLKRVLDVRLKLFRQADVAWLLSLPELKVQR